MSFLGEGLQLVVAPAVLPVAVPGVLHHLKDKITTRRFSGCEAAPPTGEAEVGGGEPTQ